MSALLDTAAIAARYQLNQRYVTGRLTKRPDFPRPDVNVSQRLRRWAEVKVDAYMRGRR